MSNRPMLASVKVAGMVANINASQSPTDSPKSALPMRRVIQKSATAARELRHGGNGIPPISLCLQYLSLISVKLRALNRLRRADAKRKTVRSQLRLACHHVDGVCHPRGHRRRDEQHVSD